MVLLVWDYLITNCTLNIIADHFLVYRLISSQAAVFISVFFPLIYSLLYFLSKLYLLCGKPAAVANRETVAWESTYRGLIVARDRHTVTVIGAFIFVPWLCYHHEILQLQGVTVYTTFLVKVFKDTMPSQIWVWPAEKQNSSSKSISLYSTFQSKHHKIEINPNFELLF